MKFTDGYWNMQKDVTAHFARQAYEVTQKDSKAVVLAPTKIIETRGTTLNLPVITLTYTAPMEDVIKVQIQHFSGSNRVKPEFDINELGGAELKVSQDENHALIQSGNLSLHLDKKEWFAEFRGPEGRLTDSGFKSLGYIQKDDGTNYIHEALALTPGTKVYGLGERFGAFVKNGQTIDIWNEDGGTSSEIAYKNIPFYMTNKGYGVFVAHTGKVSFEVGSEKVSRVQFSVEDEELTYYFIYGPTPKEILRKYTDLTGKPALPPAWSFGLWLSTSFTTNYDESTVLSFIDGMAERDIPLHTFHYDCFWMREFNWCDFEWDKRMFADPAKMLANVKSKGLHICVWINPYIAQNSPLFDEGKHNGYLLLKENGDVWQTDLWQAGMGIVDFTNPDAWSWYQGKLEALLDMGVDCIKTDFGERIPTEVKYHNNADPVMMHNYYTYLYNKCVFELLERKRGKGEACLFARSATSGGQQFPVHWGGDCTANYESMAESLRGGLSLSASGFAFWSHDISGFESTATPDLYKRWTAFGLLSTHSRLHGSGSYRVPWNFDDESSDVLRFFTKLKCTLMPYIFNQSRAAHETGLPVMRAMVLEFPNDPVCANLDMQYMLGESLLVAPIFNAQSKAEFYLPKGVFTDILTGRKVQGGTYITENHSYMSIPLFVRENTVITTGSCDTKPDYDYCDGVTLNVFELASSTACEVSGIGGEIEFIAHFAVDGKDVQIDTQGRNSNYKVLLWNVDNISELKGALSEKTDKGILLTSCDACVSFKMN
jgi:alpha-D-xyloside xylohydrolase